MNISNKGANKDNELYNISVKGSVIRKSDGLKLLCVPPRSICVKASQRIGVIMRLRNLIPTKAKLLLYKSAILPYLTYYHLVWHFCKASDTRKLKRLQERLGHL